MAPAQESSLLEMHVDYDGGNIIRDTLKWTRFLSIVGFVGVGFLVLLILILVIAGNSIFASYGQLSPDIDQYRIWVVIALLLLTLIFGFLIFMLFRFSVMTRRGIEFQDQALFQKGLNALRIYFTGSGILALLIVLLKIYSLVILI